MDLEAILLKFKAGDGEEFSPPDAMLEYTQQIHNFFSGNLDVTKLDYYFGLAFPESNDEGLLAFLKKKITDRRYDKAKEQVLHVIHFLLVQRSWNADVNRFCIPFKVAADMYWKTTKETARIQQTALDCLISLFDNFGDSMDSKEVGEAQLYWDLLRRSEKTTYQPTVRARMFHLMGVLATSGKETFMKQSGCFQQLFNHFTTTVKAQVESKDAHLEVSILYGCVKGMDKILNVYSSEISPTDDSWVTFQDHLEQIADPSCSIIKGDGKAKLKRREFQRAALELVANHGEILEKGLFQKYRQWYEDLLVWSKSPNADDNRIGRKAMYKFLETIIRFSGQLNEDADSRDKVDNVYRFFSEKFKNVLSTKDANKIELAIAVRGFGMLSGLCTELHQSEEMLNLIIQHVNNIIHELDSPNMDKYGGPLTLLPYYLESVASILPSLPTEENISKISEENVNSIKKLTLLLIKFHPDLGDGQRKFSHYSVQKVFLALWSHHHLLCEPFINEVYNQSLLHIVSCPTRAEIDILIESWNKSHPDSKKSAFKQLGLKPVASYVSFWKLLLGDSPSLGCDTLKFDSLMQWLLATIAKLDLTINFDDNDASETALDPMHGATATVVKDFQIFVNVVDFFQDLMSEQKLHKYFEKWIQTFSEEMLKYIRSHSYVSGFYKILAAVLNIARDVNYFDKEEDDRKNFQMTLNRFFRSLSNKIREYRDDLLFAVLELWLSLPDTLILSNSTALNRTLHSVFTTGKTSFSLTIRGLEAIQRWFVRPEFPVDDIKIIMESIFPILITYFTHSDVSTSSETSEVTPKSAKNEKTNLKELIKKKFQASHKAEDVTLKETQLKILELFGSYGHFICFEDTKHSGLSKDRRFLQYAIPFQDTKPEFYLDDLLPTVLDLCENAVERQTRISACEFFHTISLIFIGSSRERIQYELFKQIFQAILKLGCDSDIVVRQLFNPLCLQAIHWFSKKDSPYGDILMEILSQTLAQRDDFSLRELAAVCMGEYFAWSIKHASSTSKNVVKTIFALSTHASPDFRQASVLAFNSIYRDFREDNDLTSEFTFNLLYSFLTSLQLSKDLPDDSLLITSTIQSIKHLERMFNKKKDRFNTALKRQFKPGVNADRNPCLQDVVEWLLHQCGNQASVFRGECLRLVSLLAPLTKGCASVEMFLTRWEENKGVGTWVEIAEKSFCDDDRRNLLTFLDASSDFYNFLFGHGVLKTTLFQKHRNSSRFFNTLLQISSTPLNLFEEDEKSLLLKIFTRLKFMWELLNDENLALVWSCSMELSRATHSSYTAEIIPGLVDVWGFGIPSTKVKILYETQFSFEPDEVQKITEHSAVVHRTLWYRNVAEGELITRFLAENEKQSIVQKLWTEVQRALFKQSSSTTGQVWETQILLPQSKIIVENMMVVAISIGIDEDMIVNAAFDATSVTHNDGSFKLVVPKGRIFQKELIKALIYCRGLLEFDILLQQKPIKDVGEWINCVLELLKADKILRKKFGENVLQKAIKNWTMISVNCDVLTSSRIFAGLLALDAEKCKNNDQLSNWWSGQNLMQAVHLDLKQKSEVFCFASVFSSSRKPKVVESCVNAISNLVSGLKPSEMLWSEVEQHVSFIFRKSLTIFEQLHTNPTMLSTLFWLVHKVAEWQKEEKDHLLYRTARDTLVKAVKEICVIESERANLVSQMYVLITENPLLLQFIPVWKFCFLPAVASLSFGSTKMFFKKHIHNIILKMGIQPKSLIEWNTKTHAVYLLELLVYQTNSDFIKGAELSTAYINDMPQDKRSQLEKKPEDDRVKVVYQTMVKACIGGIMQDMPTVFENDCFRTCIFSCNEACYNTLAATLLITKPEFKFFDKFFFPGKKLFENVVDASVVYEFPIVIDEVRHKSGLVSSRHSSKKTYNALLADNVSSFARANHSGNLSGSSLAPEATVYDFTTSVTVSNTEYYQQIFRNTNRGPQEGRMDDDEISLEWNEINEHGCMFALVEIFKQMGDFCRNKQDTGRVWPTTLVKVLVDTKVHKNVKVFIIGGIINASDSLEPLAKDLIEPIIQLIFGDCFGTIKLNHFVQDIIITLLSWNKTAKPESSSVRKILEYFLQNLKNETIVGRKDIFQHIMEIFQNIVKYWVSDVNEIPKEEILSLGTADESSSLIYEVCLSVLLGNQLPHTDAGLLTKTFKNGFSSRFKTVYCSAAKCIGILLRTIKQNASEDALRGHVEAIYNKVVNKTKTKPAAFAEILSSIQQYFPEIMIRVKDAILQLSQQPKLRPDLLVLMPLLLNQLLGESIPNETDRLSPQSYADEFFIDIDGRDILNHPCQTDTEITAGLELMDLFIDNITNPTQLLKMIDWLKNAESSADKVIKSRYAGCLVKLYNKLRRNSTEDTQRDSLTKRQFLKIFIRMYDDEESIVQEIVKEFWTNVLRDWAQTSELLLELFDLVGQEESPLNVCLGLMLQRCSLSPDYGKYIFKDPLENCHFFPFQLDTSWRLRHSSFQPLFAESLSSGQNFSTLPRVMQSSLLSQRRSVGRFGMNVLRATLANLQFTPTQDGLNDSLDSYDNYQFNNFNNSSLSSDSSANRRLDNVSMISSSSSSNPILKLRRKFYEQKDSSFFAIKVSENRTERLEQAKDLERSRISGVKTVRSYRIGELPDILIRHSELLSTLLKLIKQNPTVGQEFLVHLYNGMMKEAENNRSSRAFLSKSRDVFDKVLRNSLGSPDLCLSTTLIELSISNGISIKPTVVMDLCKSTDLHKLGILKLEQELCYEVDVHSRSKRIRLQSEANPYEEDVWLGLAEMYKEIGEYDVLRNIFKNVQKKTIDADRKKIYEAVGNALHLEGQGDLEEAVKIFDDLLNSDQYRVESTDKGNEATKIFLEDAIMHSLAKLGDWSSLYASCVTFSTPSDDILPNQNTVERLMSVQVMSGMQLALRDCDEDETIISQFHEFMENKLHTEEGTAFLTSRYPFDVGIWLLIHDEEDYSAQANLMLDRGYEISIRQLKKINSLPVKTQKQLIVSLQQAAVMRDFLQWRKCAHDTQHIDMRTCQLIRQWRKCLSYQPPDLVESDLIAAHKDSFASKVGLELESLKASDQTLLSVQELRVEQELWLTNLGVLHNNSVVAHRGLARLKRAGMEDVKPLEFRHSMAKFLAAFHSTMLPEEWLKRWNNIWKKLDKIKENGSVDDVRADLLCSLLKVVGNSREELAVSLSSIIRTLQGEEGSSLESCVLTASEKILHTCSSSESSRNSSLYIKLFNLLNAYLSKHSSDASDTTTAENVMLCLLRGCSDGSSNDMLMLSNVFQLLKRFPSLNASFEKMVKDVLSYMFLPWIDQIVTFYRSLPQQYSSFKSLIDRLVTDFPQAFQLQYPEYLNKSHQQFAKALQAVVLPYKLHEAMVNKILAFDGTEEEFTTYLCEFQTILQEIINSNSRIYGDYHTDYATEMFSVVNTAVTESQRATQTQSQHSRSEQNEFLKKYKGKIQRVHETFREKVEKSKSNCINLEKLSPFLAEFHFFEHELLEKPGLYSNFKKPRVDDHPLIVSFQPTVQLFSSVTRPLKFTIIGNDGKKSNFLAKLGDDIRQDRRIQQLLKMSNILLQQNATTFQRSLNIVTYSCIAISPDYGIIEMVDNVISLTELIFDRPDLTVKRDQMIKEYRIWITQTSGLSIDHRSLRHYNKSAELVARPEAEQFFEQLSCKLTKNTLRDSISKRARNSTEFFSIRQELIRSYGAMCMVHWLLGIGDRHLENALLSINSGKLIGIDFGRAFGIGNTKFPVPELVPFRLTPQLQQLMMPYSHNGLFRESCVFAWKCLTNASDTIVTVADVFIQEPSIDWLQIRQNSETREQQNDAMEEDTAVAVKSDWIPMDIMKKKLLCHNPAQLLLEELKMQCIEGVCDIYSKIVKDGRRFDEEGKVSHEECIDILLSLATDKNILCRIFAGWNSWV